MVAYSGAVVERMFGRAVFVLTGIEHKKRVPILLNHDENAIVGHADEVKLTDKGLELFGSISEVTESGREVAALSDEGFPWEASIGLQVKEWQTLGPDETKTVNGEEFSGPLNIGKRTRLMEVSFVTAGADAATEAVALGEEQNTGASTMSVEEQTNLTAAVKTETRAELGVFLAAFPDERQAWAAHRFAEGKSIVEAKAALADLVLEELATSKAETAAAAESAKVIAKLATSAPQPGIGFNGDDRQAGKSSGPQLTVEERANLAWEGSSTLRAEFGQRKAAFLSIVKREGVEQFETAPASAT